MYEIKMFVKYVSDQFIMITELSSLLLLLYQIPVSSHWTPTQRMNASVCLRGTERWPVWERSSHILIIQRDLSTGSKFCAERVCLSAVTGRLSGEGTGVSIAVSYKEISRKGWGYECGLGWNNKSWSLDCSPSRYSFCYNKERTEIPVPSSSRIGVYLDHRAGTLSFYSVSDTMTLLHRVQTTFTQPLYPAFEVYSDGSSVKLCDLGWGTEWREDQLSSKKEKHSRPKMYSSTSND